MVSEREGQLLLAAARLMVGISVRATEQIGEASVVQLRALTVLAELQVANLMQLADRMSVTVSTTSRLVDRLVAAEFVDRRPSEQTRREISICLTETGRAVLQQYDDLRVEKLRTRLAQLPDDRRKVVYDGLSELLSTTDSAAEDPTEPA